MKVDPKTEIGKRIWEFLQDNPMSVRQLAKNSGLSQPTITRLLEKDIEPRVIVRLKIEKFFREQQENSNNKGI